MLSEIMREQCWVLLDWLLIARLRSGFSWKKKTTKKTSIPISGNFRNTYGEIYRIVDFHPFICEHRKRILRKRYSVLGSGTFPTRNAII